MFDIMKFQYLQDRVLQQVGPTAFGLACEAAKLIYNDNESTYFIIAADVYNEFITVVIIDDYEGRKI